jgi:hypothetical protein
MGRGGALRWIELCPLCFVVAGCSGDHAPASTKAALQGCQDVDAAICSTPIPSYANDVAPLLDRDCNRTCHAPGAGQWPLTTYAAVADWSDVISLDVAGCLMPPSDAGTLAPSDRRILLDWTACGAPQN